MPNSAQVPAAACPAAIGSAGAPLLLHSRFVQRVLPLLAALTVHAAVLAACFSAVRVVDDPVPEVPDEQTVFDGQPDSADPHEASDVGRSEELGPGDLRAEVGPPYEGSFLRVLLSERPPDPPPAKPPLAPDQALVGVEGDPDAVPLPPARLGWGDGDLSIRRAPERRPRAGNAGNGTADGKSRLFAAGDGPAPAGVIFALDASGSMLNKMATLKEELQKAVGGLESSQSFNIVFFQNSTCTAADRNGLLSATDANKKKVGSFLDTVDAGGTTDPIPGLTFALGLRPRVICLLTDGDFPDNKAVLNLVRRLNPSRETVIHTIAFTDGGPEDVDYLDLLQRIAAENGGKYRHVTEAELTQ